MSRGLWWQGPRGETYVVAQAVLFLLVAFGPRTQPGWPPLALPFPPLGPIVAVLLLVSGSLLVVSGVLCLRANLSPLPCPRPEATLVLTGPFRLVRHPMYSGAILAAVGWSLHVRGPLTLLYAALLFVLFDMKSRFEERRLRERFPDYAGYQARVPKLIPFVY